MFNFTTNHTAFCTLMLPHPVGQRNVQLEPAPVDLHPDLFLTDPRKIAAEWLEDGQGVTSEGITYQVAIVGGAFPTVWVKTGRLTVLSNGDILTGDLPQRRKLAAIHHVGDKIVYRYDYGAEGSPLTVQVYLYEATVYMMWEAIWDANTGLYSLFEDMRDGLVLDPSQEIAVFESPESAVVFLRSFPTYEVMVQPLEVAI